MTYDVEYYLNEYKEDSSLPKRIAELFAIADTQGLAGTLDTELFLIVAKFVAAFELRHRMAVRCAETADVDAQAKIAAEFAEKCSLAEDVREQLTTFVQHLADGLTIPPA